MRLILASILSKVNTTILFLVSFFLFFILLNPLVLAQEEKVFINEFLIEPAPQAVELFNTGSESADISDWYLDDSGGSTYVTIQQGTILFPNSCAVFTGDFNFNKSSADAARLFDAAAPPTSSSAQLIDSFAYKSSSGSGISFSRLPDGGGSWTTGSATLGKFNATDQSCVVTPTIEVSPTSTPTPVPTQIPTPTRKPIPIVTTEPSPTPTPISYDNIYLSEVYVYPQLGEKEWVELYNNNEFSVSLEGWFVDDAEGLGSSPKTVSLDIPAKDYAVFELSFSMFNNGGDSVRLLDFDKTLKDGFEYSAAEKGKSWVRTRFDEDASFCQTDPTRQVMNNTCVEPTPKRVTTQKKSAARPSPTPRAQIFIDEGKVLGVTTKTFSSRALTRGLSLASLLQSLLTIVSVLLKMKK